MYQILKLMEVCVLDEMCIIDKRKVILAYILVVLSIIGVAISTFINVLLFPTVILIILVWFVNIKYIRCSNCDSIILLRDLSFSSGSKYCKNCGFRIELE